VAAVSREVIAEPAIRALIDAAGERRTVIKSISAKQRPRQPKT